VNRLFYSLIVAFALCARAADPPLSAVEFTRAFVKTLRETAPSYTVRPTRELQVIVTDPKGLESTVFLYDAYAEYRRSPKDEDRIIRRNFVAFISPQDEIRKLDRSRIVPVVKKRSWLEELQATAKAKGQTAAPEVVYDDLNDQLIVVYAEDNPNTLRYIVPDQLEAIGLKKEDLRALAATNLQAILPKIEVRPSPLISLVKADGNYEACLLAVPDFWSKGSFGVEGEVVVAIPARDHLLITGSRNVAGLAKMREIASHVTQDSPQRLTDTLFVYRDGRFVEFKE
jgi:uncharacterized protein YtpQ (UPF0354 family)